MSRIIKIKFTNNRRPAPENFGVIPRNLEALSPTEGLYMVEHKASGSSQEFDDFLRAINLHPCVQLAWIG